MWQGLRWYAHMKPTCQSESKKVEAELLFCPYIDIWAELQIVIL